MTVIAWDGKTLAADRLAVFGGMCHEASKIFEHKGVLYGVAGHLNQAILFKEWIISGQCPDHLPGPNGVLNDLHVFEVYKGKAFGRDCDHITARVPLIGADCWAIGSGRELAMGAMLAGKDAQSAVRLACAQDTYCDCMGKGPEFLVAPVREEE